ncbi:MAG: ATP synthase F1 subunit delta [Acidimicrobiia bacterium]|nr:ATP synthase F1 subunit delta [Acidimicrobiia bacterium]
MADRIEVYADSLLPLVRAEDPTGAVADELYRVARLVESNDQLRSTLTDPQIPAPRRQQVLEELLGDRVEPLTAGILSLLVAAGRMSDMPKIVDALVAKNALDASRALAEVRSAVALTPEQEQRLASALERAAGRPVDLKVVVDPTVLGGLVAQIGDTVIDGSVRTRLTQLREVL